MESESKVSGWWVISSGWRLICLMSSMKNGSIIMRMRGWRISNFKRLMKISKFGIRRSSKSWMCSVTKTSKLSGIVTIRLVKLINLRPKPKTLFNLWFNSFPHAWNTVSLKDKSSPAYVSSTLPCLLNLLNKKTKSFIYTLYLVSTSSTQLICQKATKDLLSPTC